MILNYPDPFEHPNAYWHAMHNNTRLTEREKQKELKAACLDYYKEPKPSGEEVRMKKAGAA